MICLSCGYQPNHASPFCVHHIGNDWSKSPNGNPAFFAVLSLVILHIQFTILKDRLCLFKAKAVFAPILPALVWILIKRHAGMARHIY
jgi:hypothetical protein